MRNILLFIFVFVIITVAGCNGKPEFNGKYSKYFAQEEAVDLSDVIKIYEKHETDSNFDAFTALLGKDSDAYECVPVINGASSFIHLPQYGNSHQPFLSRAEVFYNSCQLAFNVWSDYELWLLRLGNGDGKSNDDIERGIKSINEKVIANNHIQKSAIVYKDKLIKIIDSTYDEDDVDGAYSKGSKAMGTFSEAIEIESYKFYANEDKFVDSLDSMKKELRNVTIEAYNDYVQTDSLKRVGKMLHSLDDCGTFDEQCSLLMNWADSKLSIYDGEWIIAVAYRLLNSGKYNPCLNEIWIMWRSLFQPLYCGSSKSSSIPNEFYNKVRKKCYLTCLKRIESNPEDVFAMNSAASIGGRVNVNRFGPYPFGNQAATDEIDILPKRWKE